MPYLKVSELEDLKAGKTPVSPGELNADVTLKEIIPVWKANPRYATIHQIAKDLFDMSDEDTARFLAFLEFYRRVGSLYEDAKASVNGDLYAESVNDIFERELRGQ